MRKFGKESAAPAEKGADRGNSGNGWLRSHWCVLALAVIVVVAFLLRFVSAYGVSADGDFALSGGSSAQYHLHVIESILAGTWSLTDMSVNYPIGGTLYIPPLMDFLAAGVASIFQGSMGTTEAASFALGVLNPIFGALLCIPVYLIGKELFDKTIGVVAALVLAFMALPISTSVFSSGNEYALAAFLVAFAVYFLVRMVKAADADAGSKKGVILFGLIAGVFVMLSALTWNGFRVVIVMLAVAMVLQAVASRIRGKDFTNITLGYSIAILVGAIIPAAYYVPAGLMDSIYSGSLIIAVVSVVFTLVFAALRSKPWVVTIPALVVVFLVLCVAMAVAAPGMFDDFIWGNSPYVGTMDQLVSDRVSMSNVAAYYGWLTMWLPICLAIYEAYVYLRRDHSATQLFMTVWLFVMFFAAWTSYDNAAVIACVFGVGAGAVIVKVLRAANLREWVSNIRSAGFPGALRKLIKPLPFASVIVVVCLVIVPNVSFAVDAGTPTNTEGDHFYTGNTNFTISTGDSYPVGQIWDSYADTPKDGALVSWVDYVYDSVAQGGFDNVNDTLGSGTTASSHVYMAEGSAGAIAAMAVRIMMSDSGVDYSGCFDDSSVYNLVRGYIDNPDSARAEIEGNPGTYGSVRSDLTDENAVYLASINAMLTSMDELEIYSAYDAICDASGDKIGYVLLDGSMLPLSYGDGDSFSTIAYFAGYSVDRYGAATQYYSYNTYYGSTQYTDAIYDTFLWKALVGPSATDAGYSSSNSYLNALAYSDGTVKAIPGYGLTGFTVTQWLVMYNPEDNATSSTDGWVRMDGWEAMDKQEAEGGTINYLAAYVMLEYTGSPDDASVLTGQVQQASGEAISGATVSVYQYSDVYGDYVLYSETTSRNGTYNAIVPSGSYRVDISIGNVLVDSFTSSSTNPTTVVNDSVVTGEVQVNGDRYDGEDMMLSLSGGAEPDAVNVEITDGTIRIDGILPGTYSYVLYGEDGTSLGTGSVSIYPGESTGLIITPTTRTITATVEDVNGNAIDGTSYDETPVVVATNVDTGAQFVTEIGEDGQAVINVIPGTYTLSLANGLTTMTDTTQNASNGNRSATLTAYTSKTVEVDNAPAGVPLSIYAGEFSTVSYDDSGVTKFDVPVGLATDTMSYSIYGVSGDQIYYGVYTGGDGPVTLQSGTYSKVTGTLKDGEDGTSGTVTLIGSDGYTVRTSTDSDGSFTILAPTGSYTVYAYNSAYGSNASKVYLGSADVSGSTTDLGDLSSVDGRRISFDLRYNTATSSNNADLPFAFGMISFTYNEVSYQIWSMTNDGGRAYFYIPDGIEAVLSFNNAEGTLDNDYFACTDMVRDVSSGDSSTSRTVTIQYYGYSDTEENLVKRVPVTLDFDATLQFYEGGDTIEVTAGQSVELCPGEYEITVDGSSGYYFDGTAYLYPGQTEFTGLDVQQVVTVNVTKNEADAISIQSDGSYHSFNGGYYLEVGYEYYFTSTNSSDANDVKIRYGYVDLTGDSRDAVSLDMTASQSRMEVTGYVGINADGTITLEFGGVKVKFDVTDGAYTLALSADMTSASATVEVSTTVNSVDYWFSETAEFTGMTDGCIRNVAVLSSDAPDSDTEENDDPAFDVTIDDADFTDGRATVDFTITNNGDATMTYLISSGTAWSLDRGVTVTVPAGESVQSTVTGYYDATRVAPGLDGVDLVVSDINGTDTVTEPITMNSSSVTGDENVDVFITGDEGAANDRISASQYMYAVTLVNNDVYAKNVTLQFTVPDGWYAVIVNEGGTSVVAPGGVIVVYGMQTVTYYIALMQEGTDPVEEGQQTNATVPTINVTLVGADHNGSSTISLEPQDVAVNVDDSSVSGGDALDERSGLPSGIWFLVGVIILMVIAVFWLASKRGVFSRR